MVKKIKNNDFSEVEASKIAIVNFSVTGNESCQIMEQIINETADEYTGKVDFYRANIAINQESPKKYDVENIPAVTMFINGEKIATRTGFQPKEIIEAWIESKL